jgi:exodeoxyribonuclease-5
MVVKNNYFWLKTDEAGFIANGDIIEILEILILRNCMVLSLLK